MYSDILMITKSLQAMAKTQEGRFRLRSRFYWVAFQKPKIIGLRATLEAYKSDLALMLGTLNIAEKATRPTYVAELASLKVSLIAKFGTETRS